VAIAVDSGVVAGTSANERGRGRAAGSGREGPQQRGEPVRQVEGDPGVGDGGLDLGPVADDAPVGEQPLHVGRAEAGHRGRVETGERGPERLALAEDRQPGQPGLESLQAQLLEQPHVVPLRDAPLVVVVRPVVGGRPRPPAPAPARRPRP
jgi:hypothetical protein